MVGDDEGDRHVLDEAGLVEDLDEEMYHIALTICQAPPHRLQLMQQLLPDLGILDLLLLLPLHDLQHLLEDLFHLTELTLLVLLVNLIHLLGHLHLL